MRSVASCCLLMPLAAMLAACSASRDRLGEASSNPAAVVDPPKVAGAYQPMTVRDDQFLMGRRESDAAPAGAAAPSRSSSALVLASSEANRELIYVQAPPYERPVTEKYQHQDDNPLHLAREQPFSTFAIDVDTGAYANVRRFLTAGSLPPRDAVRVEELINWNVRTT